MSKVFRVVITLFIYAVAMALVEAAVVVYLRELYYPGGFLIKSAADLEMMPANILKIEIWREAATLVMLATVGYLAFRKIKEKFLAFVFAFSVWDIFYYIFLYIFLGWPQSLKAIDVYFLIPQPWIGPVWFPLVLFIVLGAVSFYLLVKRR